MSILNSRNIACGDLFMLVAVFTIYYGVLRVIFTISWRVVVGSCDHLLSPSLPIIYSHHLLHSSHVFVPSLGFESTLSNLSDNHPQSSLHHLLISMLYHRWGVHMPRSQAQLRLKYCQDVRKERCWVVAGGTEENKHKICA